MNEVRVVDPARTLFAISRDLKIDPRVIREGEHDPGIDGMTLGIVTMATDAPHGGEVHHDGDEILYVISGKIRVHADSMPADPIELKSQMACIVPAGEWHRVEIVEPAQIMYVTPGPNNEHRPIV